MMVSLIIVVMVTMVMVTVPVMAVSYQLMSDDRKKSSECSTGL